MHQSPLVALIRHADYTGIEQRLEASPSDADARLPLNLFREKALAYPLHYLCKQKRVPTSTLKLMAQAAPDALDHTDSVYQSRPLHVACWHGLPLAAIELLLDSDPEVDETLRHPDVNGNLPLHLAAFLSPDDVLMRLLKAYPQAALVRNAKGQTPLHCACERSTIDPEVFQVLVQTAPQAVRQRDVSGRLPIHLCCISGPMEPIAVYETLLQSHPESINDRDRVSHLHPYAMLRNRHRLGPEDSRIQLLRLYRQRVAPLTARCQFWVENHCSKRPKAREV